MDKQPLVSVIISTYNREKYIKRAIESVLNQTYKNIELIIIDDCSIDNTLKIISEEHKKDPRIVILKNKPNLGFAKSLNKGIASSHGKYIARIDDDDFWSDSKKLEKQINFLENHIDYVLTGGGAIWIDAKGREIVKYLLYEKDEDIRKHILSDNCFVHSAVVFKKSTWEKTEGYNEKFGINCDWGLWLELGKFGKFYNFPEYFIYYMRWSNNNSNFNIKKDLKNQIELRKEYSKNYPGYKKAFFLGWIYYFSSFLPFRQKIRPLLIKVRTIIFGSVAPGMQK